MMLQNIISQSNYLEPITDITTPFLALPMVDISLSSVYWFTPYLSSDFPSVTCDKTYFFLYSTDHNNNAGGIYWGKGDLLDLSDFQEVGKIIDVYQAETPFLVDFPNETRRLRLYYHTVGANPLNNGIQETNLITSAGGLLHENIWTQEANPLGVVSGDTHTGYFKFWEQNNGNLRGIHYKSGSNIPTIQAVFNYSNISSDGLVGTRDGIFDQFQNAPEARFYSPTFGEFFKKFDRWWWIGTINSAVERFETKVLGIAKANDNFEITELITMLNNNQQTYTWSFHINGDTSHCYLNDKTVGIWYAKYDLRQLENYL